MKYNIIIMKTSISKAKPGANRPNQQPDKKPRALNASQSASVH